MMRAAAGTKRAPDGQLPLPRHAAREHQAGDIQTRDEQHDAADHRQDAQWQTRARAEPVEPARAGPQGDGGIGGDLRFDAAVSEHRPELGFEEITRGRVRAIGHARDHAHPVRLLRREERVGRARSTQETPAAGSPSRR